MSILDNKQTLNEFVIRLKENGIDNLSKDDKDAIVECFERLNQSSQAILSKFKTEFNIPVNPGDIVYVTEHVLYNDYYRSTMDEEEFPFRCRVGTVTIYPHASGGGIMSVIYDIDRHEITMTFGDIGKRVFMTKEDALAHDRREDVD